MCDQASFKTNTCSDANNVVGDSLNSHEKYPVVLATKNTVHNSLKTLSFAALKQMEMLADILKKTPGFDNTNTTGNVSKSL